MPIRLGEKLGTLRLQRRHSSQLPLLILQHALGALQRRPRFDDPAIGSAILAARSLDHLLSLGFGLFDSPTSQLALPIQGGLALLLGMLPGLRFALCAGLLLGPTQSLCAPPALICEHLPIVALQSAQARPQGGGGWRAIQ